MWYYKRLLVSCFLIFMTSSVLAAELIATPAQLYYPSLRTMEGNANGNITLVEFFDYRCGYCREIPKVLFNLVKNNPNIRIVYRDYPMLGQTSLFAAGAALSAQQTDKYLAMHRALLAVKEPLDNANILQLGTVQGLEKDSLEKGMVNQAVMQQLQENIAFGKQLKISGIPTFIVALTPAINDPRPVMAYVLMAPSLAELQTVIANIPKQ